MDDPLDLFSDVVTRLHTQWLKYVYPFYAFGQRISIDHSCQMGRAGAQFISLGDDIYLAPDTWLNIVGFAGPAEPKLILGNGCRIGRRSTLSAKNRIELEADVLLAPNVLIMDHNHNYSNTELPIHAQGVTEGGQIRIGRNSWLGYGCVVFCAKGHLTLGRNCVVGANSVVTRSFPDFSVIAGNPARLIKAYDSSTGKWHRCEETGREKELARVNDAHEHR